MTQAKVYLEMLENKGIKIHQSGSDEDAFFLLSVAVANVALKQELDSFDFLTLMFEVFTSIKKNQDKTMQVEVNPEFIRMLNSLKGSLGDDEDEES